MSLKTKLYLSFGFLFLLIVVLSSLGSLFIRQLATDSRAIIQDNYRTLNYMQGLKETADELTASLVVIENPKTSTQEDYLSLMEGLIALQRNNITEPGEDKLTETLERQVKGLGLLTETGSLEEIIAQIAAIQQTASTIYALNAETLLRKNERANTTAERNVLYMAIIGLTGSFLSFLFIFGFPEIIFEPLTKLNEGIKAITSKKYNHQLTINQQDEIGEIAHSFNVMASKLKDYESSSIAQLHSEKTRIEAIINQMHEGVIGVDENGHLIFLNAYAAEIANVNREEVMHLPIRETALKNDFLATVARDIAAFTDGQTTLKTIQIIINQEEKTFTQEIIPIPLAQENTLQVQLAGCVIVLTDITQFNERDKAKTAFIATVSHELKTPIASIGLGLQLLRHQQTGLLNEEQRKLIKGLEEDKNRLLSITSELLDITQAESGKILLEKEIFSIHSCIQVAQEALQRQLDEKNVSLELTLPKKAEAYGDENKVTWVIINLLSNAIRYSYEDTRISVRCTEQPEHSFLIEVEDYGKGIPDKYQDQLFQKYYQVPGSKKRGTGLGLAISKEFIEAMDGQIGVSSQEGQGARFWLTLPKA
ncbi:multi-sensor signal transduction histidine kinase [Nitritalea halalkaliphila LW7]|uniref:histidine kinase n=1 Tax=Nitritalea halalkaliphila LW7 TaxID=1189621 RepID=I5C073_9BACT|nr:ATP-binding protein [Nitritalea halalkaliphila]EIM75225.1 multi-sensor signal transduction histidine kinase [Nitritalea halalkaliphila LW7]